ncbi:glycosyltransferase family 90 protein [Nemania sp. NC0429]|nr:glycosyltransferase family 90 protein [Nemania sp. NC0429]
MRSSAFPPRRPSHLIRYVLPFVLLIGALYYLSSDSDRLPIPTTPFSPAHDIPPVDNAKVPDKTPDKVPDEAALELPVVLPPPERPNEHGPEEPKIKDSTGTKDEDKAGQHAEDQAPVKTPVGQGGTASTEDSTIAHGDQEKTDKEKVKSGASTDNGKSTHADTGVGKEADNFTPVMSTEPEQAGPDTPRDHPIDELIKNADKTFKDLLAKESSNLTEAAQAYRERRGRHPPPGFDKWFEFAQEHDAIIVEDFFDRIYHDLNPFWGLDPKVIRKEAWDFEMTINIRNHNATAGSDWFWTKIWLKMIKTIEHLLPDLDIALNALDEPRLVVPWEDMAEYMQTAERTRKLTPVGHVVSAFHSLPPPGNVSEQPATRAKKWEETGSFWSIARRGCSPDSHARRLGVISSFDRAPALSPEWANAHQYEGYVSNFSLSTEFCHQPDLQGLEGIFIHPLTTRASKVLFPLFGGSKLATNNEILLPAPMYWSEEERFTGGDDHGSKWEDKMGPLVWRGVATGGRNQASNWRGFQRHRFVAMNNGTKVGLAAADVEPPVNFELPASAYDLMASKEDRLGEWISEWADVGFTELMCDPDYKPKPEKDHCPYVDQHFEVIDSVDMADQFMYKYLPDIDGNSFSGRYLGFLRSTGVPIKSTMWHEWHDSRLVAWKHFVPMDNRFGDYYGIMEYFLGYVRARPGHDAAAKKIAMEGKAWAEAVLRKEDMQIYVLRLLLEYARVSDDQREKMGWVDDLKS